MKNTLYYGDNLDILRKYIPDESVDLIYLDPPFNSKINYNILFREPSGNASEAQITAFEDTWHWTEEAARTYTEIMNVAPAKVAEAMSAFKQIVGLNDMMAYLTMMCARLLELRRVLKSSGSIYLHCDPTASHYLKILLDTVFGPQNFRNEIIWKRTSAHSGSKRWGPVHDVLLFYGKSENIKWHRTFQKYTSEYVDTFYRLKDEQGRYQLGDLTGAGKRSGDSGRPWRGIDPTDTGRHWAVPNKILQEIYGEEILSKSVQEKLNVLDEQGLICWPKRGKIPRFKRYFKAEAGVPIVDVITDINPISAHTAERLGYPTQKPESLIERILQASSSEGDIVLDPFCGCGTTISVAQRLNRKWMGIDVTHLAINLIKWRLKNMFALEPKSDYLVVGEPEDFAGARELFSQNRYQFQWWATSLINARPYGDKKKGADTGIDGYLFFSDEEGEFKKAIVQVKGGKVDVKDIRDLGHVVDREKAHIGIFLTLESPTKPMQKEALQKGFYHSDFFGNDYPRIQILTVEDLFAGKKPNVPNLPSTTAFIKKAPVVSLSETGELDLH